MAKARKKIYVRKKEKQTFMGTLSFVNDILHDAVLYTDRGIMSFYQIL
jgi:hypothetical protein